MTEPGTSCFDLETGRTAFRDALDNIMASIDTLTPREFFASSRCFGWQRIDLISHIRGGFDVMAYDLATSLSDPPTHDPASFWSGFAEGDFQTDQVTHILSRRRHADAYRDPTSLMQHVHDNVAALRRILDGLTEAGRPFGGEMVLTTGDYLATWALEFTIHHLDLDISGMRLRDSEIAIARPVIESLAGRPLPGDWDAPTALLVATGRLPVPEGFPEWAEVVPVLG